jgi:hypothetical protein
MQPNKTSSKEREERINSKPYFYFRNGKLAYRQHVSKVIIPKKI